VRLELAKDLPPVEFDICQIQQVLVNTIYNAAEALAEIDGERHIVITTGHKTEGKDALAHVSIRDNGHGVMKDKLHLLFEKRFTTKPRGHGIGLITCKRILDTHTGMISYNYQDGACFEFQIPLAQPQKNQQAGQSAGTPSTTVPSEV
jgi:signal transduction histidine kinase